MQNQSNARTAMGDELNRGILELGIHANLEVQAKMLDYITLMSKWNKVYNLTAIRDIQEMVSYHLLDSLAIMPYLRAGRWLDVGCGAGLPGLVLAIMQPQWNFTLLDSNSKKTGFVQQAVIDLGLKNVIVHCGRVEEFEVIEKFDGITSRAFTDLGEFIKVTRHLLSNSGYWAAMKGLPEKEIAGVPADCLVTKVINLTVPGITAARSVVIVNPRVI